MPIAYAILAGVAPIILTFLAAFFGLVIQIGWPVFIAWFVVCLVVGAVVTIVRK